MKNNKKTPINLMEEKTDEKPEITDILDPADLKEGEYIICPGCGEKMPNTISTCVTCGARLKHSTYTPISEKKASAIRAIVGVILVVAFFVFYFFVIN